MNWFGRQFYNVYHDMRLFCVLVFFLFLLPYFPKKDGGAFYEYHLLAWSTQTTELNYLRIIICLRKFETIAERISACNDIEK